MQIFLNSVEGLYLAKERYEINYKRVALLSVLSGALSGALTLLLIVKLGYGGEGRIYAHIISSLVIVLPMAISIIKKRESFDKSVLIYVKSTLLPLLPHYLSLSVMAQAGRIIISQIRGRAELGSYGAAGALSIAFGSVTVGISNALFPWINRHFDRENMTRVMTSIKNTVILISFGACAFLGLAPFVYRRLYPSEYCGAILSLYPLTLAQLFAFLSNVYSQLMYRIKKVKAVSAVSVFGALVCVLLSSLCVLKFGIFGAGLGLLLGEFILALLKGIFLQRAGISALHLLIFPASVSALIFFTLTLL